MYECVIYLSQPMKGRKGLIFYLGSKSHAAVLPLQIRTESMKTIQDLQKSFHRLMARRLKTLPKEKRHGFQLTVQFLQL